MIVSLKIYSIGKFFWLGKSQFTLLLVLINFISAVFHAYKLVYIINEFCIQTEKLQQNTLSKS